MQAPCTWRRRDWGDFFINSKGIFKVFYKLGHAVVLEPPFGRRYFSPKGAARHIKTACMKVAGWRHVAREEALHEDTDETFDFCGAYMELPHARL